MTAGRPDAGAPTERTIVVPLDGSAFAEDALPHAMHVAAIARAAVRLVRVVPPVAAAAGTPVDAAAMHVLPPVVPTPQVGPTAEVVEKARADIERLARTLAADARREVTGEVLQGPVVQTLQGFITTSRPELVVMSTHGTGGLHRMWLGSVADTIVREGEVPVLAIKPREGSAAADTAFRRVLVPLDGSPFGEAVLPVVVALMAPDGAAIEVMHVAEPMAPVVSAGLAAPIRVTEPIRDRVALGAEYLDRVAGRLRAAGISVHCHATAHASAARAIVERAGDTRADVVAMTTHGYGGVRRMLLGSVADKVLRGVDSRVLVLRPAPVA